MKIQILKDKSIRTLQSEFQLLYPFLKIECYSQKHESGHATPHDLQLNHNLTIGEISGFKKEGEIQVDPILTVTELEDKLSSEFGIFIQVFRQSGSIWLQTVKTDNWTLGQQNQEAKESVKVEKSTEAEDYHEQE